MRTGGIVAQENGYIVHTVHFWCVFCVYVG